MRDHQHHYLDPRQLGTGGDINQRTGGTDAGRSKAWPNVTQQTWGTTGVLGNENRPVNVAVRYLIRVRP